MFFSLPKELVSHIFEFCLDKREQWNRVIEQFLKGLFIRDVVLMIPKEEYKKERWVQRWLRQHYQKIQRGQWEALRPSVGRDNWLVLPIIEEWSLKTTQATCGIYVNSILQNTVPSGANPVTEWLKNIKEFEHIFPSHTNYI